MDDEKVCPRFSLNKEGFVSCFGERCPYFNAKYGCIEAYDMFCSIERWEFEKKLIEKEKEELRAKGDISIS